MRRDTQKIGLRHDRQHRHKAVAFDRASRGSSSQFVECALERCPRGALADWKDPVEFAPTDLPGSTCFGEWMATPRNHDKAIVEQNIDTEFMGIDGVVNASEH